MIKKIFPFIFILSFYQSLQAQSLFINEICASNYVSYTDSSGDHGDWIELYNGAGASVDVGGMYLTDDLLMLTKCQIPTVNPGVTTIPAGGHLIFWFDNKSYKGITHVNTSLNSGGEQVG